MKLSHILSDLVIYFKNFTRSREGVFFTFIFPIILIAVFGSIFSGGTGGSVPLYVQNLNGTTSITSEFLTALNQTHLVKVHMIPADANVQHYVTQHSVTAALVIPAGFTNAVQTNTTTSLPFYYNPAQSSAQIAQQAINLVVEHFNARISGAHSVISVIQSTNSVVATSYIDYLIPGLIGFTILTSPMFMMTYIVSSYKKEKIFRQFSLTPLTKGEWLFSRFTGSFIIALLSAAEMILTGVVLFHAHVILTILILPFILIGVVLFVSLGTLAGALARTEEGASVIGNIITFPMMFLAGTFFPVSTMPSWLQGIAHVLPLYYIIDGLNSVMIYTNNAEALFDAAVSVILAALFFVAAMAVFSWKEE
ncbi:MAG: ABC transporter permease [Thermoplasmata archaeon]|nr:ABC transporter permease [Candidatus Sysuiplasma acidicola]MBX8646364.1 ABC transporter permease [Candidatus Sysuiplasma acidicola]